MLPGPVFTFDLMITGRRGRFYLARALYAAVLFVILWNVQLAWLSETGGELSHKLVNWFAFSAFCGIAIGQELLVLALTPALVAGVIADEKKRKTLHYLLASQLTSAEIVVGKLLVRMLYVVVLLGVSLPVLSLLVLLGGIDPWLVVLACGATLSTAWFLASLSIWVSTIARRPRDALFIALGLECLWLCLPSVTRTVALSPWPAIDDAVRWLGEWAGASSPVEVVWQLFWARFARRRFEAVGSGARCLDDRPASGYGAGLGDAGDLATASDLSTTDWGRGGSRSSRAPIDLEVVAARATGGAGRAPDALEGAAYRRSTRVHLVARLSADPDRRGISGVLHGVAWRDGLC